MTTYVKVISDANLTPDTTDRGGEYWQVLGGGGGGVGTVTSVGVTDGNGFNLTVTNPTSTPTISLATTVTGMVKGNGTALSAAVQGTDYYAPGGTDVAVVDGGTGASTAAGALTNLGFTATITELNYTDGVTSAIQTQLDAKVDIAGDTMTGALIARDHGTGTTAEIGNIIYDTGAPPAANTVPEGTIFVQYNA